MTEPNAFEKAIKSTGEFVDSNITGTFSGATDAVAKKAGEVGLGEDTAKGVMPWLAGGAAALIGVMLLEPIQWVVKSVFKLARNVLTLGGMLENIPIIGGLFTAIGDVIDTVGEYAGYVVPAIAAFIGYKAFQTKSTGESGNAPGGLQGAAQDAKPALEGSTAAIAVGLQAGLQSNGQRIETLRTIITAPESGDTAATSKQIAQLRQRLGDDGFNKLHKEMFGSEPPEGKVDARFTSKNASKLLMQIDTLEIRAANTRLAELNAVQTPKVGFLKSIIRKIDAIPIVRSIPGIKQVVGWAQNDIGQSAAKNVQANRDAAIAELKSGKLKGLVVDQLVEDVAKIKQTTPQPAVASTMVDTAPDAPEPTTRPSAPVAQETNPGLSPNRERIGFASGSQQGSTNAMMADDGYIASLMEVAEPLRVDGRASPGTTGTTRIEPFSNKTEGTAAPAADTPENPVRTSQPAASKPSFLHGAPRAGYSAGAGGAAILGGAMVLADKDASTEAKIAAGGASAAGLTAVSAELAGATRLARGAGVVGGVIAAPLNAVNAYHSFTKENATAEDYLQGGISTAYTAGTAAMMTGVGFVPGAITVIGAGVTDIGHKGYQAANALSEISRIKEQIDNSFVPSANCLAANACIQGRLKEKLVAQGVTEMPFGDGTWIDLRDKRNAYIAKEVLKKASADAKSEMDENNYVLLPRFFSFTDHQKKVQQKYESARMDYMQYEQALQEYDNYVQQEQERWKERDQYRSTEASLGTLSSGATPNSKDSSGNTVGTRKT